MDLIILAGGKSSRFGKDKAFVKFEGVPIIERILSVLGTLFVKCLIVTNNPAKYRYLKLPIVEDIYKNAGPLGGIHAGLSASDSKNNFVVACDMPLIERRLVKHLLSFKGYDAVVPRIGEFAEPLFAVYSKDCLPIIEKMIRKKAYKISSFYDKVRTKFIPKEELRKADPALRSFCNLNTIAALKEHERKNKNNQA